MTVSVLNGSGVTNQATTTSAALGALGFTMVGVGDSPPVGAEAETVVYYASKTPADIAAAQAVARSLSGAVIIALGPTTDGAKVTVVTGTEFTVNPPAAPATPATTAGGTATTAPASPTTSTTAASNGAFQAPTAAISPLQPWDPRACPA